MGDVQGDKIFEPKPAPIKPGTPSKDNYCIIRTVQRQESATVMASVTVLLDSNHSTTIAASAVAFVAVVLFLLCRVRLGWPPPPGTFIAALASLAFVLAVWPVNIIKEQDQREETAEQRSRRLRDNNHISRRVNIVRGLSVFACFLLMGLELYAISFDRRASDEKAAANLISITRQMTAAESELSQQLYVNEGIRDTASSYASLLSAENARIEASETNNPLKKDTLNLAAEMMRQKASDELAWSQLKLVNGKVIPDPILGAQAKTTMSAGYSIQYRMRFDRMTDRIRAALLVKHGSIDPAFIPLLTWQPDEWALEHQRIVSRGVVYE